MFFYRHYFLLALISLCSSLPWLEIDLPSYPNHLRTPKAPLGVNLNSTNELGLTIDESANLVPWYNLLHNLQRREKKHLHILILGGSMTAGHLGYVVPSNQNHSYNNCDADGNTMGPMCAYPRFLQEILQEAYPNVVVNVTNLSIRGCDSQCLLSMRVRDMIALQREQPIDAVFIHMSSNEFPQPANLAHPFEALIRFLLELHSKIAVIVLQMLTMHPPHLPFTRHYQLPVITVEQYADTSTHAYDGDSPPWDVEILPKNWWPLWKTNLLHPEWPNHRALAQFLYQVWAAHSGRAAAARYATFPETPLVPRLVNSTKYSNQICYDAKEFLAPDTWSGRYTEEGGWIDGEDVPGKPGLWLDSRSGGEVKFKMLVRKELPVIGFYYLQSYVKMGFADVFIEGEEDRKIAIRAWVSHLHFSPIIYRALCVDGRYDPNMHTFPPCDNLYHMEHRSMEASLFEMKTLVIRLRSWSVNSTRLHNKFKIVQVMSC